MPRYSADPLGFTQIDANSLFKIDSWESAFVAALALAVDQLLTKEIQEFRFSTFYIKVRTGWMRSNTRLDQISGNIGAGETMTFQLTIDTTYAQYNVDVPKVERYWFSVFQRVFKEHLVKVEQMNNAVFMPPEDATVIQVFPEAPGGFPI